ncbi:cell division control protein 6 homolog B-like [Camellia sinensis]|uniref:cell division control protein 6 homolog B-like n=1 Tax=Camellia sinensis TaxID=4442 RepID=UPI0010368DCD|nr:cell division control protein 6 homolog B-like [Camellia sinensis]
MESKREDEKKRVLEFCKQCIEQEKAGSLYVCGCPGTGKSLMERVKDSLVDWAQGLSFKTWQKVAAASGDMRKALCICRSAIEMLQAELRESACNLDFSLAENGYSNQQTTPACYLIKQGIDIVRVDHMAIALSKTYRSPIMDTIQSLPQHQQIILCSAVKLFRGGKKDTTIGELSKSYLDICKLTLIPPVGIMELSSMCRVLGDQGLLKLGQSREDKLRRVALKVDEADVAFALQGIRVFRDCLNACL